MPVPMSPACFQPECCVIRYIFSLQIQVLSLWLAILGIGPTVISQEGFGRMCSVSSISLLITETVGAIVIFHGGVCPGGGFFNPVDDGGSLGPFMGELALESSCLRKRIPSPQLILPIVKLPRECSF